jgi:hypothetical protein
MVNNVAIHGRIRVTTTIAATTATTTTRPTVRTVRTVPAEGCGVEVPGEYDGEALSNVVPVQDVFYLQQALPHLLQRLARVKATRRIKRHRRVHGGDEQRLPRCFVAEQRVHGTLV